jgi:hypothetical protein
MYIKSIVIDGFKSYAQRTEVNGFDPMFNAITGLNGSGKSNILDAICFLLGITNLSQVRIKSFYLITITFLHAAVVTGVSQMFCIVHGLLIIIFKTIRGHGIVEVSLHFLFDVVERFRYMGERFRYMGERLRYIVRY